MENVAPASQHYLGTSPDNHHMSGSDRSLDDFAPCLIKGLGICERD
jgi:hypothetical protein